MRKFAAFACPASALLLLLAISPVRADHKPVPGATKPLAAKTVLDTTYKQAKAEKKSVFLHFGASWCVWCKRLEAALDDPEFHKIMAAHYVLVKLDVQESPDKKALENPGGNQRMADLGGEKSGLPFFVFLDAKGKKLADSNVMPNHQNIGYPGAPEEIDAFEKLLKQTAPRMTEKERGTLIDYLKQHAPTNNSLSPTH